MHTFSIFWSKVKIAVNSQGAYNKVTLCCSQQQTDSLLKFSKYETYEEYEEFLFCFNILLYTNKALNLNYIMYYLYIVLTAGLININV